MSDPDRTPSSCKSYTQGHGSTMTSMHVKWCPWHCCTAMKRLRPAEPCFGIMMVTSVKKTKSDLTVCNRDMWQQYDKTL